jgi:hypothetical protein
LDVEVVEVRETDQQVDQAEEEEPPKGGRETAATVLRARGRYFRFTMHPAF